MNFEAESSWSSIPSHKFKIYGGYMHNEDTLIYNYRLQFSLDIYKDSR